MLAAAHAKHIRTALFFERRGSGAILTCVPGFYSLSLVSLVYTDLFYL